MWWNTHISELLEIKLNLSLNSLIMITQVGQKPLDYCSNKAKPGYEIAKESIVIDSVKTADKSNNT